MQKGDIKFLCTDTLQSNVSTVGTKVWSLGSYVRENQINKTNIITIENLQLKQYEYVQWTLRKLGVVTIKSSKGIIWRGLINLHTVSCNYKSKFLLKESKVIEADTIH